MPYKNFFKDFKSIIIITLSTFFLLEGVVFLVVNSIKKHDTDTYLSLIVPDFTKHVNMTYTHLTDISKIFYDMDVNTPQVKEIMYKASKTKNPQELAKLRKELLVKLSPTYTYMKKYAVRQLHFQLPQAVSFLRFHRPQKFGDSLIGVRETLEYVNQYRTPISAFEEGRIFNGFRNVYPIYYHQTFVGTVEISFSFSAIQEMLAKFDATSYIFMIKKSIVGKKVFHDEKSNYTESAFPQYTYDKKTLIDTMEISLKKIRFINKEISKQVEQKLQTGNSFSFYYRNKNLYNNHSIIISFVHVPNLNEKTVAYIIHYQFGEYLDTILHKAFMLFWLLTLLALGLSMSMATYLVYIHKKQETIHSFAVHDALTGIYNRHGVNELLNQQIKEYNRTQKEFSLLFFDIDFFKRVNDTYGHEMGDYVLVNIAKIVNENIRSSDIFARWGGEEFLLFLPHTKLEDAKQLAEKLRATIEKHAFSEIDTITCSFGVTLLQEGEDKNSFIKRADTLLYKAKSSGRNCVVSE